jgi:hypothetical protein
LVLLDRVSCTRNRSLSILLTVRRSFLISGLGIVNRPALQGPGGAIV